MPFDYKKEYKTYYLPKDKPEILEIPAMNFVAVRGKGDPNEEGGAYKAAVGMLYGISYTIKMSPKAGKEIEGFFEYVVPPLEGLWWQEGLKGYDITRKDKLSWVSMIRLPDFVTQVGFEWAVAEATRKKGVDFSQAEFFRYDEGLCVQCMHIGPYDLEIATVGLMDDHVAEQGYELDFSEQRLHHEIYLSDPTKADPAKLKTVIRHPVRKKVS